MESQSVIQMIKDVRTILEENVNSTPLEGVTDVGTISINQVIEGVLTKAVTAVAKVAPMELFSSPTYKSESVTAFTSYNGGYFNKESDYLRTLYVQMPSWQRPVMELTALSSPFVSIARSSINLSVGNDEKPLVVDSFVGGKGSLEVYPVNSVTKYLDNEALVVSGSTYKSSTFTLSKTTNMSIISYGGINGAWFVTNGTRTYVEEDNLATETPYQVTLPAGTYYVEARVSANVTVTDVVDTAEFVYIEQPKITGTDSSRTINCDEGIYNASVFYAAYLVAMVKGYQNTQAYKTAALEALTYNNGTTNATAGAPIVEAQAQ